jgi:hypothetical protein
MGKDRDRDRYAEHHERDGEMERHDRRVFVRGDDPPADRCLDDEQRGETHGEPRRRAAGPLDRPVVAREGQRADDGQGDRQSGRDDGEQPMEVFDQRVVLDPWHPRPEARRPVRTPIAEPVARTTPPHAIRSTVDAVVAMARVRNARLMSKDR